MLAVSEWRRRFVSVTPIRQENPSRHEMGGDPHLRSAPDRRTFQQHLLRRLLIDRASGATGCKKPLCEGRLFSRDYQPRSRFRIIFLMQKATFALMNWSQVRAFSLADNRIHVITDDGRSQDFHFSTNEDARKAFNARSSSQTFPLRKE